MAIAANFSLVRPSLLLDFSNQTVLDPRVTFARTTTALFYDNKSAALAEQNLLLQSNTFTNAAWTVSGVGTPVVGATDPAGGATAYTLTASVGSSQHYFQNASPYTSFGVGTFTVSAYLQAGTNNFVTIDLLQSGGNWAAATFNLTAGSVAVSQTGSAGNLTYSSSAVTQVGSTNWWRCSLTFAVAATAAVQVIFQLNNAATFSFANGLQANWTALGTETLLVYGAQLEQRSAPTVYTATTATAVNTYTPTLQTAAINAPRFDYNPTTRESLGLLLEQASTNLALYSSDYTNAAWTKANCTITAAASISPDGSQNAQLMVLSASSSSKFIYPAALITFTAATYTFSVYVKSYGQRYVQLGGNSIPTIYCNFDLTNGIAGTPVGGSSTANIQDAGNGWYRCSLTYTAAAGSTTPLILATTSLTSGIAPSFAGNGFNGYLIWGAQVELAPSATSYIANTSIANARTVDSASMTGTNFTSWYNYSGGTVYIEASAGSPAISASVSNPVPFEINDGTVNNFINVNYIPTGVQNAVRLNNVYIQQNTIALPATIAANTFYKTAFAYSTTGTGVSSVGQTASTTAISVSIPAVNQLNFTGAGRLTAASSALNGRIKKFAYYPLALTNTQIQSLSAN